MAAGSHVQLTNLQFASNIRHPSERRPAMREDAVMEFEAKLRGQVIRPGDAAYDETRKVYNGMHDRRPSLIVLATGVADVIATVRFAREHEVVLAVRGGGHSAPGFGTCEGGLVLDLRRMRGIRVDPEERTARVEGGCTLGDVNHATYAFGLAAPFGIASTTGVAGLTLGGGMGYLTRRCGLSCDNLLSADVVTADGAFVTCSVDHEEDLFWALRGGGGNFGVVTSFEFRLHPVADIVGGPIFFPLDGEVVSAYRDFIVDAPEELGALFAFTMAAPLPFVPEKWHGILRATLSAHRQPPSIGLLLGFDDLRASAAVKVTVEQPNQTIRGRMVFRVQPEICRHVIDVPILVEVARREAIPPSGDTLESAAGGGVA